MSEEKNLLGVIGLCRSAGKLVIGSSMVCDFLRKRGKEQSLENDNKHVIVLEASDTSENTHKKITDKCIYYNVKHVRLKSTCTELGKAVGKGESAAVAVTDKSFCRAILAKYQTIE